MRELSKEYVQQDKIAWLKSQEIQTSQVYLGVWQSPGTTFLSVSSCIDWPLQILRKAIIGFS